MEERKEEYKTVLIIGVTYEKILKVINGFTTEIELREESGISLIVSIEDENGHIVADNSTFGGTIWEIDPTK